MLYQVQIATTKTLDWDRQVTSRHGDKRKELKAIFGAEPGLR